MGNIYINKGTKEWSNEEIMVFPDKKNFYSEGDYVILIAGKNINEDMEKRIDDIKEAELINTDKSNNAKIDSISGNGIVKYKINLN